MAKGLFATYHPAVCMVFFLSAVCLSFCTMHPVYIVISCLMAGAYLVFLRGARLLRRTLSLFIPMIVFIALLNSLFSYAGETKLFSFWVFNVSLEGLLYGIAMGGMLVSVLIWFACYNEVMTEDKFTYLFGRAAPTISLMVSMVSRWVPRMVERGHAIYDSQEALIGGYDTSKSGKLSRGMRMATVLAGLGMEDSVQTSDSMRARGYGTSRRTSYARYSWHARERAVMAAVIALLTLDIALLVTGAGAFKYYPTVSEIGFLPGYVAHLALLAMPFLVELERLRK